MFLRPFTLLFLLVCASLAQAQVAPDSIFYRDVLAEDLEMLRDKILACHPDPFGFCTEEEFNARFEEAIAALPDSMTYGAFIGVVSQAMNVMRDSHSCINYNYVQSELLDAGYKLVPLRIVSLPTGIYIERDRDGEMPNGTKLYAINDIPISELYTEALQYACIEGDAWTGQRRVTDAIFPIVVALRHPLSDTTFINGLPPDSNYVARYGFISYDRKRWEIRNRRISQLPESQEVRLTWPGDSTVAMLRIGTFAPDMPMKYRREIRDAFRTMQDQGATDLIIDLRDNSGGSSSWVEYLFSFISAEGHNTPTNIIGRQSDLAETRVGFLGRKINRMFLRLVYGRNEDISGFLRLQEMNVGEQDTLYFTEPQLQKKKRLFTGPAYLVINGLTASAAVDFTHAFFEQGRGQIVGESCLGPMTGTWGNPAPYRLENTSVPVFIATIRYNYDNTFRYQRAPIVPHHEVPVDPADLVLGVDTQVAYILDLIRRTR